MKLQKKIFSFKSILIILCFLIAIFVLFSNVATYYPFPNSTPVLLKSTSQLLFFTHILTILLGIYSLIILNDSISKTFFNTKNVMLITITVIFLTLESSALNFIKFPQIKLSLNTIKSIVLFNSGIVLVFIFLFLFISILSIIIIFFKSQSPYSKIKS